MSSGLTNSNSTGTICKHGPVCSLGRSKSERYSPEYERESPAMAEVLFPGENLAR